MERIQSNDELEPTVRYFNMSLSFDNSLDFVHWLRYDWEKSVYYNGKSVDTELKSIDEILLPFKESPEIMFYMQNCTKNDVNGNKLIYCFVKDESTGFRMNQHGYISYRSYVCYNGYYSPNKEWKSTIQNPKSKKWILLATNKKRYRTEVDIKND